MKKILKARLATFVGLMIAMIAFAIPAEAQIGKVTGPSKKTQLNGTPRQTSRSQTKPLTNRNRRPATANNADANRSAEELYEIGEDYYFGRNGKSEDRAKAFQYYKKAADKGSATGMRDCGFCLLNGIGVKENTTEAIRWYKKAADKGDDVACDLLGDIYRNGTGVDEDYSEAARWYRKGADRGNSSSQTSLGLFYFFGYGVTQDYSTARY